MGRRRWYRIVKEPALSDFHTNSQATAGNHSKIKIIHHPRALFYSVTSFNSIPVSDVISLNAVHAYAMQGVAEKDRRWRRLRLVEVYA